MAFTYDPTTDRGKVRLLISDTSPEFENQYFDDAAIDAFLAMTSGVKRAAALALDTLAANEALVSRVIRTQDLQTDGAKVAEALRRQAQALRDQADADEDDADDAGLYVLNFDAYAAYRPTI